MQLPKDTKGRCERVLWGVQWISAGAAGCIGTVARCPEHGVEGIDKYGSTLRTARGKRAAVRDTDLEESLCVAAVQHNSKSNAHFAGMGKVHSRASVWRRRVATGAAGAMALTMAYGVVFGHNGLTVFLHKRQETLILQQQMLELERENERLQGHVQRLQTDPGAIEHEARAELHYTRAGEVIYTLPATPPDATKTQPNARR